MQDNINHPEHYTHTGVEAIEVIEAWVPDPVSFCLGNVLKYLARWQKKGGIESLEKARWYLDRAIQSLKQNQ